MPFAVHARAEPDLAQQRDGPDFQYAGANAREHVNAALPSGTTLSMPLRWRICDSSKPAGPPPMIATWVRVAAATFARDEIRASPQANGRLQE